MLFSQGTEWIEVREKIEQLFNQIAPSFFGKIDAICDELIARIYKIRNRQNEVSARIKLTVQYDESMNLSNRYLLVFTRT